MKPIFMRVFLRLFAKSLFPIAIAAMPRMTSVTG